MLDQITLAHVALATDLVAVGYGAWELGLIVDFLEMFGTLRHSLERIAVAFYAPGVRPISAAMFRALSVWTSIDHAKIFPLRFNVVIVPEVLGEVVLALEALDSPMALAVWTRILWMFVGRMLNLVA
jgi:hypothetical protein